MKKLIVAFVCGLLAVPSFAGILDIETSYSSSPVVTIRRARGHFGAEEHLFSGDIIGGISARGRGLTSWASSAGVGIYLKANQDWTASAQGTKITFETTPDDSTTAAEVMSIDDDGNVAIAGNLTVTGTTGGTGLTSLVGVKVSTASTGSPLYFRGCQTEAILKTSTPTYSGATGVEIYYDVTNETFVQSTGTTNCLDWGKFNDPTTAPVGW